jgi:hypothetical protein
MALLNKKGGMRASRHLLWRGDHELGASVYVAVLTAKSVLARLLPLYKCTARDSSVMPV